METYCKWVGRPGGTAIFGADRRVAGLPVGGPRDPLGRRSSAFFCWVRPRARPPAPAFGVRCAPRTAIPFGIALFALNLSSPPAEEQRAPSSCSPPRGVAADCATLRVARAQPNLPPCLSVSGCALRGWAEGPARRPGGSKNRRSNAFFCQVQPCRPIGPKPAGPKATSVAGLRGGRLWPARLYESQKLSK